jgi:microcystin-dependent protein
MADPTAYARSFDFSDYQANNPSAIYPGAQDDAQFDAVAASLATVVSAIQDVRRSDGALKNSIVTPDSLSQATLNLLDGAYNFRGNWLTATAYALKDVLVQGTGTYVATVAHTSGTFATDLAAGKWVLIAATASGYTTTAEATTIAQAQITALALKLDCSNGPLTGNLTVQKSNPTVVVNKAASGENAQIKGQKGGVDRWTIELGNIAAESGSNTGARFTISRYTDLGVYIDSPIDIARDTGRVAFTLAPTAAADAATATGLTTLQQVEALFMGAYQDFAHGSAPAGWLLANGQNVSRTTYAKLFAKISTLYGSGDGSTTFTLPDLRGRARFGRDDMGGSAANRVTNAVSGVTGTTLGAVGGDQRIGSHTHGITDPGHTHAYQGFGFAGSSATGPGVLNLGNGTSASNTTGITVNANASAGSSANLPPAMIVETYIFAGTV